MFESAQENDIDMKDLIAISCDGTPVNTEMIGGTIRLIEMKLEKPIQHFICHLHTNKLPLRHFVERLDGKTSNPHGFTGPIGRQLSYTEKQPIIAFNRFDAEEQLWIVMILAQTKNTY